MYLAKQEKFVTDESSTSGTDTNHSPFICNTESHMNNLATYKHTFGTHTTGHRNPSKSLCIGYGMDNLQLSQA